MNVLRCLGERFCKNAASVFLVLFSLSACAAEKSYPEKPPAPTEPKPVKEVTFTLNADGKLTAKGADGKAVITYCSADPSAPNACPIFTAGHKVQVEEVSNISVIQYSGSPRCYLIVKYPGGYAATVCF